MRRRSISSTQGGSDEPPRLLNARDGIWNVGDGTRRRGWIAWGDASDRSPVTADGGTRAGWGRAALLVTVGLLALAVRWGTVELVGPVEPIGDEVYYAEVATQIALGNGHVSKRLRGYALWPPGQAYVLSLFVRDADLAKRGPARRAALLEAYRRAALVLSTLLVIAVAGLGAAVFDRRVGATAGAVAALYPTLVAFGHYLWSETLFALLAVLGWWASWEARARRSVGLAAAAGLAFGLAALTRELGLLFAGAVALWWVGGDVLARARAEGRTGLVRGFVAPAALVAVAGLVVVPWTLRNGLVLGGFVPVSTVGWMGVREGNTLRSPDWMRKDQAALDDFRGRYFSAAGDLARQRLAREEALERIGAEQPTWLGKKIVRNGNLLLTPDDFVFKKLSWGAYGDVPPAARRAVLVATIAGWVLLLLFGSLAFAADPLRSRAAFALFPTALTAALHIVANASPRYRVPLLPLWIAWGAALGWSGRAWLRSATLQRLAAWGVVALFFLVVCIPWFAEDVRSLWESGAYADPVRD